MIFIAAFILIYNIFTDMILFVMGVSSMFNSTFVINPFIVLGISFYICIGIFNDNITIIMIIVNFQIINRSISFIIVIVAACTNILLQYTISCHYQHYFPPRFPEYQVEERPQNFPPQRSQRFILFQKVTQRIGLKLPRRR